MKHREATAAAEATHRAQWSVTVAARDALDLRLRDAANVRVAATARKLVRVRRMRRSWQRWTISNALAAAVGASGMEWSSRLRRKEENFRREAAEGAAYVYSRRIHPSIHPSISNLLVSFVYSFPSLHESDDTLLSLSRWVLPGVMRHFAP